MDDKMIELTPIECELLLTFVDNLNQTLTSEELYRDIWNNQELSTSSNTLRTHITHLRRKLQLDEFSPIRLDYIRNKGYRLTLQ